ncbi:MAG: diphthamide biosynthesis enzyme Dph2 [Candidatus Verstraetearchaeota archaeon]|nr:diphthamide biosynthesis enzyme Dph2 [Candidatus Verstraetearchaeota archaeon]
MYELELEKVASEVTRRGARKVLVQAPDGLKQFLRDFIVELSKLCKVYVSGSPCYGGCDLEYERAQILGVDLVIHIGHEKFLETKEPLPTLYIPALHSVEAGTLVAESARFLKERGYRRVGLLASVQHRNLIPEFAAVLEGAGISPAIDSKTGGVVLGCRTEGAKRLEEEVDAFLLIGGGDFHALGVALDVEKEVFIADPYRGAVRSSSHLKRRALAKRWWAISQTASARNVGLVVVMKTGQHNPLLAESIAAELEILGKEVFMIAAEEVNWERLSTFTFIESFVVTGCPRIALDNREWIKPVLNEYEVRELIRMLKGSK